MPVLKVSCFEICFKTFDCFMEDHCHCRTPTNNLEVSGEARFKCECQPPHRKFRGSLATLMEEPLSTLPFYLMVLSDAPSVTTNTSTRPTAIIRKPKDSFEISLEISQCEWIRLSADFASMLMTRPLTAIKSINLRVSFINCKVVFKVFQLTCRFYFRYLQVTASISEGSV